MTEEEKMEIGVISNANLQAAFHFVNQARKEYEIDESGAGICTDFIYRLLNDLTLRGLDFDDEHFKSLSDRFDQICKKYQEKGLETAYLDNAREICRNATAEIILAFKDYMKGEPELE